MSAAEMATEVTEPTTVGYTGNMNEVNGKQGG
jgi:hypothetical protein